MCLLVRPLLTRFVSLVLLTKGPFLLHSTWLSISVKCVIWLGFSWSSIVLRPTRVYPTLRYTGSFDKCIRMSSRHLLSSKPLPHRLILLFSNLGRLIFHLHASLTSSSVNRLTMSLWLLPLHWLLDLLKMLLTLGISTLPRAGTRLQCTISFKLVFVMKTWNFDRAWRHSGLFNS